MDAQRIATSLREREREIDRERERRSSSSSNWKPASTPWSPKPLPLLPPQQLPELGLHASGLALEQTGGLAP